MLDALEERFEELEASRRALFDELRARSPEVVERRPTSDSWSMRQVAQHLWLVEKAFIGHARRKGVLRPPQLSQRLKRRLFKLVFGLRLRIKAPTPVVLPEENLSLDEIEQRWDAEREALRELLDAASEDGVDQPRFLHPIAGPLTAPQFLDFLADHFAHHRRQLQRIAASPEVRALEAG